MTKNHPNGANRAIGYARVSTSEQAEEGISLQVQEDSIRAYAQLHGLTLTDILSDRGESGKDLDREAAQELLARVRAGEAAALIVYRLDRLTRSPRDLFLIVDDELNPRGVEFISVSEQIDTRTLPVFPHRHPKYIQSWGDFSGFFVVPCCRAKYGQSRSTTDSFLDTERFACSHGGGPDGRPPLLTRCRSCIYDQNV
jgi:hypothetical protein